MSLRKQWTANITHRPTGTTEQLNGHITQDDDYTPWDENAAREDVRRHYDKHGSDATDITFHD